MHFSAVVPWLALVSGITAFTFTKPDLDKKLNLSAETISIAWVVDPQEAAAYQNLSLQFSGRDFSYTIVKDFPLALGTGEYGWNPKDVRDAMGATNKTLSSGKDFFFKAKMTEANSSRGAGVSSDKYAVEGYSHISPGNQLRQGLGAWLLAAGVGLFML